MGFGKAAVLSVVAATVSMASAQSGTTNPSLPDDVQVSSPRWNGGSYDGNPLQGVDQLLTQTVTVVPQAKADSVAAKWTYRKINRDLHLASSLMQRDFRESDEYDQAFSEFQAAYDEYDAARVKALSGLRSDERYRAVESMRQDVSDQIADEHGQKDPDAERLVSLAGLKIDSIASFREQERDTLAADQNVVEARQRLVAAGKKLAKVERDFARKIRNDSGLADLRRDREEARIAMLASAAYLDEARVARNIAVRYAYTARGYDRYVPRVTSYGYGYGGYGYHYAPGYHRIGYPVFPSVRFSTTSVPFHNNTAGGIIR